MIKDKKNQMNDSMFQSYIPFGFAHLPWMLAYFSGHELVAQAENRELEEVVELFSSHFPLHDFCSKTYTKEEKNK